MSWLKNIFGTQTPEPTISFSVTSRPREIRYGLPVYEAEIKGEKLARRNVLVTDNGEQRKISIEILRAQFRAGALPADAPVLVTNVNAEETYYCGEGTVASVVAAWESAPLEAYDVQDAKRMIQDFKFPEYEVQSKAQYHDLKRLYDRCDRYYRYVAARDREFKRLTKEATRDLVFLLDESDPTWDSEEGEKRFAEELRKRQPEQVRSESEKKAKKRKEKELEFQRDERRPLIETRNNLTNFPHKDMPIEIQGLGTITIREIKPKLREGVLSPESLVRYRNDSEWVELCEFLSDWMQKKATVKQLDYLKALQRQHSITKEIALDSSREEISQRIQVLAP